MVGGGMMAALIATTRRGIELIGQIGLDRSDGFARAAQGKVNRVKYVFSIIMISKWCSR
jgi:hypothetical protein